MDKHLTDINKLKSIMKGYTLDKVKGCIFGGAIGDALGYAVEFDGYRFIVARFGEKGITRFYGSPYSPLGGVSDDTQMTLFTATGLLEGSSRVKLEGDKDLRAWEKAVTRHYLDWKNTQVMTKGPKAEHPSSWLYLVPELHERRAPGNTCMSALISLEAGHPVSNNSKGCGGVMRVAPVALCRDLMDMPASFVTTLGGTVAEVTHQHPLGFMPAALMTDLLRRIMDSECGNDKECLKSCVQAAAETVRGLYGHMYPEHWIVLKNLVDKAVELADADLNDVDAVGQLGEGWVGDEALAIAIYCALKHYDSFEDAVVAAVNHNGDSDSTGAICGNILGLVYGYEALPSHFKDQVELADILTEVAEDLWNGCPAADADPELLNEWKRKYLLMDKT
jgi:ADP-ribosylglycohydrolase